jgi:hypothetical protein
MATKSKSSSKSKTSNMAEQLAKSSSQNIKTQRVPSSNQINNPSIESLITKLANQYISKSSANKVISEP